MAAGVTTDETAIVVVAEVVVVAGAAVADEAAAVAALEVLAVHMGYYILKTTEVATFITSLEQMHCPRKLTIPLSVMFRFIPTIKEEGQAIKRAMKMRGIDYKYALLHPLKYLEFRVVPLLNSVIKIGNELSMASITRGLTLQHARTNMITLTIRAIDWIVIIVIMLLGILYYVI